MNDLQAGRISLATAKAQWPHTTYEAGDNVHAFRSADATVASAASGTACHVGDSTSGPAADAVRSCAASMAGVDHALAKARVAIAPWERHIVDQTHFAMGVMTSAAAEAWRVMWKKGPTPLTTKRQLVAHGPRRVRSRTDTRWFRDGDSASAPLCMW